MELFNYVMVLASIIVGLAITHLLQGVARLVQHPGREKLYWVHLVWVASIFELAVFWWWSEFKFSTTVIWTFELYLFLLCFAVVLYLLCTLLFPGDLKGYQGFEDYFYSRRAWFFGLNLLYNGLDVADTLLKGWAHFVSLGWHYSVSITAWAILFVIAIFTRNRTFHAALAIAVLVNLTSIAVINFHIVQ
jgi:hypothetical protein